MTTFVLLFHHQHRQRTPPGEWVTALTGARVLVVILPDEARLAILLEDIVDDV